MGKAGTLLVASWGFGGVCLLLGQALTRLTPLALEPWRTGGLLWWQGGLYLAWVAINAYAEGYRGFQRQFCPRVIGRLLQLAGNPSPRPRHVVLAPLYCMSLVAAPRRDLTRSWSLLIALVTLITLVRALSQPWRGIIDGGVVVGLGWGVIALAIQFVRIVPQLAIGPADVPRTSPLG